MKNKISFFLAGMLIFSGITNSSAATITRIEGADRYTTSAQVANTSVGISKDQVVVASGESFPDAISGGYLSGSSNSVLLLTQKNSTPQATIDQIRKISPKTIYLLGGTNTVSQGVENNLKKYAKVVRLAGRDRYETSTKSLNIATEFISKKNGGYVSDSYLVSTGKNFTTPLISSAYALNTKSLFWLDDSNHEESVFERIDESGSPQEVSINSAKSIFRFSQDNKLNPPTTYYFCSSNNYADALVSIPLIGRSGGVLILLDNNSSLDEVYKMMDSAPKKVEKIVLVGGKNSISNEVENALKSRYR